MNPSINLQGYSQNYRHGQQIIQIGVCIGNVETQYFFKELIEPKNKAGHKEIRISKNRHQPGSAAIKAARKVMMAI